MAAAQARWCSQASSTSSEPYLPAAGRAGKAVQAAQGRWEGTPTVAGPPGCRPEPAGRKRGEPCRGSPRHIGRLVKRAHSAHAAGGASIGVALVRATVARGPLPPAAHPLITHTPRSGLCLQGQNTPAQATQATGRATQPAAAALPARPPASYRQAALAASACACQLSSASAHLWKTPSSTTCSAPSSSAERSGTTASPSTWSPSPQTWAEAGAGGQPWTEQPVGQEHHLQQR